MNLRNFNRMLMVPLTAAIAYSPAIAGTTKKYSVNQEVMLTNAEEGRTLRLSGYGDLGSGYSVFGFIDSFGSVTSTQNTYGELHGWKNISGPISGQAEINSSLRGPPIFRTGSKVRITTPKGTYADVKVLPLNVSTEDGFLDETLIGFYGSANFGKWYIEDWIDHVIRYGEPPSTIGELTVGRYVNDNFLLQAQLAKDTNSPGLAAKIGGRYKIF